VCGFLRSCSQYARLSLCSAIGIILRYNLSDSPSRCSLARFARPVGQGLASDRDVQLRVDVSLGDELRDLRQSIGLRGRLPYSHVNVTGNFFGS